jgi:hypothetical protein
MPEIKTFADSFYPLTWIGPKGYPEHANGGRCYIGGTLGMLRHFGEPDVLFADGTSGDGFSFRWCPTWGAPTFVGGAGPWHEIWEYTPKALGFAGCWEQDNEGGWEGAFERLCGLIDRGIPVQVVTHYNLMFPFVAKVSPRFNLLQHVWGPTGFGHHVVIAGYNLAEQSVVVYEPNDLAQHSRYECPIDVFRRAWEEAAQWNGTRYEEWPNHYAWNHTWSLHDGYGPYLLVWIEPTRDPSWDIRASIRHSYRRNLKILSGEYPKPYALFGNCWQIPHFETGAPGMAACAAAILRGEVKDPVTPTGEVQPLFVVGNIPNHGVLGRTGAAGYLRRVARELAAQQLNSTSVQLAAKCFESSSELFKALRYEPDLQKAGGILSRIAAAELDALQLMREGWEFVSQMSQARWPSNATKSIESAA